LLDSSRLMLLNVLNGMGFRDQFAPLRHDKVCKWRPHPKRVSDGRWRHGAGALVRLPRDTLHANEWPGQMAWTTGLDTGRGVPISVVSGRCRRPLPSGMGKDRRSWRSPGCSYTALFGKMANANGLASTKTTPISQLTAS